MKILHIAIYTLLTIPATVHAISFDCAKATTFVEKEICGNSLLGKLDDALAENYKHMLSSNIGDGARKDLRATQKKWLSERNKCINNQCLIDMYKNRVDEVCEYPVLSGVAPACNYADDVGAELSLATPQKAPVKPEKTMVVREPTQVAEIRNAQKIKQLKLPSNFVNSTIYVNYLGQWVAFMSCSKWLGLLFENNKIESIQSIFEDGNPGVSIKRPGRPSFGLLFRIEGKEAYLDSAVFGNNVEPIQTPSEHSQMAVLVKSLTSEETTN